MYLGKNLQYLRRKSGITQEQLAEGLGVSRQAVSKWEAGQSYPEMDKLLLLCNLFGCTMDQLVREDLKQLQFTPAPTEDAPLIIEPAESVGTQAPPHASAPEQQPQPAPGCPEIPLEQPAGSAEGENRSREQAPKAPEFGGAVPSYEQESPFVAGEDRAETAEEDKNAHFQAQADDRSISFQWHFNRKEPEDEPNDEQAVFFRYHQIMDRFSLTTALGVMLIVWGVAAESYMDDFMVGRYPEGLPLILGILAGGGLLAYGFLSLQRFKLSTPPVPLWVTAEERANSVQRFSTGVVAGIILILVGLGATILQDYMAIPGDSIFLMLAGAGVAVLIYSCLYHNKLKVEEFNRSLAKNPDWNPRRPNFKSMNKLKGRITAMIMPAAIAFYLAAGMFFGLWHPLWVILPFAALLCGLIPVIDKPVAAMPILGVILFFAMGIFFNMWHPGWALIVISALISGLIPVLHKPEAAAPILGLILFFIVGPFFGLWHPGWVLIPLGGMVSGIISIAKKN